MSDAAGAAQTKHRRDTIVLVGIIAVGGALRFFHLGAQSFWLDEALSVVYARMPWPQFVHLMLSRELNMLPYYLLLRAWIHLGTGEWLVRSLSAICSIATIPLMYRLGVRLLGTRAGLLAATLLALHPYHIRYAQEARGYSLMLLLVTASTLLLLRAIESPGRHGTGMWIAYVAASVLASYTHFFATLAILAQWASIAIIRPGTVSTKTLALAGVAIIVLLAPLAAFVLMGHADPAGWIPHPTGRRVEYLVYSLLAADNTSGARIFAWPVLIVTVIAAGVAARSAWRTSHDGGAAWHFALIAAGAVLPIALTLAVSLIKPIFVDKYLLECLPFAVLLLAAGLSHLHPQAFSIAALLLLLGFSAHADYAYYRHPDKDDWRAASHYVVAAADAGDEALFFPSFVIAPFDYYRAALHPTPRWPIVVFPDTAGGGNIDTTIAHLRHQHRRLWALFNQDGEEGSIVRDSLSHRYPILQDRQFTGVRVLLYDLR